MPLTIIGEDPLIFVPPAGPPAHLAPPPPPPLVAAPPAPVDERPFGVALDAAASAAGGTPPSPAAALAALGGGGLGTGGDEADLVNGGGAAAAASAPSGAAEGPTTDGRDAVDVAAAARAGWLAERIAAAVAAQLRTARLDLRVGLAGDFDPAADTGSLRATADGAAGSVSLSAAGSWYAGAGGRVAAEARWHAAPGQIGGEASFSSVTDATSGQGSPHGRIGVGWRSAASAPLGVRAELAGSAWDELGVAAWAADLEAALLTTQWLPDVGLEAGAALSVAGGGVDVAPVLAAHLRLGAVEIALASGRLRSATRWLLAPAVPEGSVQSVAPLRQPGWHAGVDVAIALGEVAPERTAGELSLGGGYAAGELLRLAYDAGGEVALERRAGSLWWASLAAAGEGARWRAKLRAVVGYGQHSESAVWSPHVAAHAAVRDATVAPLEWLASIEWRPGPQYAATAQFAAGPSAVPSAASHFSGVRPPPLPHAAAQSLLPFSAVVGVALSLDEWFLQGSVGPGWDRTGTPGIRASLVAALAR